MTPTTDHPVPGRHNLYDAIHRGLRLGHARLMASLGATDFADPAETDAALADLRAFLALARGHLESEETVIHPAIEQAEPGATSDAHEGHEEHDQSFAELADICDRLERAAPAARAALGRALYRRFCRFAAADIVHMDGEEQELLGRMHRLFTDEQLQRLEGVIVGRITPDKMTGYLRLILPALSAPERAGMMAAMRAAMPPVAFQAVMADAARASLTTADYARLDAALRAAA